MPSNNDYDDIKRSCLRSKTLWEDPDFPATDASCFFSRIPPKPLEWKRPKEICIDPQWVIDGASRLDIQQGMLGDCWLLSAISSLACNPGLLKRVLSQNTSFQSTEYCGVFRFRLWRNGAWEEVLVDDRLPTYNGKLVFLHSVQKNEFWCALLEKAFAKLSGSYEALKGGQTSEAMTDVTGGLTESFDLTKAPKDLFKIMQKAIARNSLMGCSIAAAPDQIEAKAANGLVKGHAYSVTGVQNAKVRSRRGELDVELVRVRNPWGNEREWTGAWGDKSEEWGLVADDEKQKIGLTFEDDGEFWMSYRDFISNFTTLEICNLGPDTFGDQDVKSYSIFEDNGAWVRGSSAGGCRNFLNTFATNPQFRTTLRDVDDDDDDLCTVIVAVMQKDRRKLKKAGGKMLTIGFAIYEVDEEGLKKSRLDRDFFAYNASKARSPSFVNSREIVSRFKLKPGTYCIVPSTFDPDEEGAFLVRIYAEKEHETIELDVKSEYRGAPSRQSEEVQKARSSLDEKFHTFFLQLAGADEFIDSFELQAILTKAFKAEMGGREFSLETARCLISKFGLDKMGKVDFESFKNLWVVVKQWKAVFDCYDQDKSGTFNLFELRSALHKCGLSLSNRVLNVAVARFANRKGTVSFDDFIQCVARTSRLFEFYQEKLSERCTGGCTLDEFIIGVIDL